MTQKTWIDPTIEDLASYSPQTVFEAGLRNHDIANTAYPIAHTRTWGPYRVPQQQHVDVVRQAYAGVDELGLYIHIPFCEHRCLYCEYCVVNPESQSENPDYMEKLFQELDLYRDLLNTRERTLYGFDIGGGTPGFVDAQYIAELMHRVRDSFKFRTDMVVSIETTPKLAATQPQKLHIYRQSGIQRISIGLQVTQRQLLKAMEREATGLRYYRSAVDNIRAAGFDRLNVDLMYGFAGQSLDDWRATIEYAIGLGPEYITTYRVRYKGTRIAKQAADVSIEQVREQVNLAKEMLAQAGYPATPGKNTFSRIAGNSGASDYLTRRVVEGFPYLGMGLGAQSFSDTTLSYNAGAASKRLAPYQRAIEEKQLPIQDLYNLPRVQAMGKMVAISFYFGEVDRAAFATKFGINLEQAYPEAVDYVLTNGLMTWTDRSLRLTGKGHDQFNGVIALFYAPSVQEVLIERYGPGALL
ncbi:MAG: radical SAM protein [Anaerolineales bacterium]|nr:MAG: radical SAM protein [Anaerolineales bacterium]